MSALQIRSDQNTPESESQEAFFQFLFFKILFWEDWLDATWVTGNPHLISQL